MLIKIIILVFSVSIVNAQYFDSVQKEAEKILISLSDGNSLNQSDFNGLKNRLSSGIGIEVSGSLNDVNQKSIDSLEKHLIEFELEIKNISTDSSFVLFYSWYLHLQNIFYEYAKQKFFSSPKQKILFFSTSMSCYCTLKMSREQTVELLRFISENNDQYDYWIIDSFEHNKLQIEYETLFSPSVIVFDGNNKVLYKIEYEEKMLAQLTDYLNHNKH